jgi:drug/metabolite transporter (DMT)-like permease
LGRRISRALVTGFVLVLGGVMIARWGGHFQWTGFAWSIFGAVMNGILYELFARATARPLQKCFWGSLGMGVLGLFLSTSVSWTAITEPKIALLVLGFVFVGGFLYWIANLTAFNNLPTTEASVLAQVETPAVILGASFLLGEHLTVIQWIGVVITLCGAGYLSHWISKQTVQK